MTFAELITSVGKWLHENMDEDLVLEALSDSSLSLWETLILVNLSEFMGGPATGTFAQANLGSTGIVSIADPVAPTNVIGVVQGALAAHNVVITFTYVTDSGAETLPSPVTNFAVPINQVARVASPAARISGAVGWNCYNNGIRQNLVPIQFGTDFFEPNTGFVADGPDAPVENTTADDIWYLQTLSVRTPDGGEKFWQEEEVGSELWRQFAKTQATNSPYQPYVYDFDGSQVNIRPLTGGTVNFNYFFVRRPRAFKYRSSALPFRHPAAALFVKYNAISLLELSVHEYAASNKWAERAEQERLSIVQSANKRNSKKGTHIKPIFR